MPLNSSERIYRTEGIVLKGYDYGEADRILTFYTPTRGKLRALAKGVRKTKSRMSGHIDLFTRSNLMVARGRQLDIVTQAETVESYSLLRKDLWRSTWAHYVAEIVDGFTVEEQANYPLYALAALTFRRLADVAFPELAVRAFEVRLLSLVGYRPQLFRCLHCNSDITPGGNRFTVRMGGVLCPVCASVEPSAIPISDNALKMLRNLQSNEEVVVGMADVPVDVGREVERDLQEYIVHRLESRPRSLHVLERLRQEGYSA
jgi:DNA repair protein RecO (recombination protein O)